LVIAAIESLFESLPISVGLFVSAALFIAFAGTRMSAIADCLADKTGLGEAIVGVLFLGSSTSLSGLVTSVTAAAEGHAELSISNALGGIAAQTVFLGIADITYCKANLEHAVASETTLAQVALLINLLAIPLLAMAGPDVSVFGIHPASFLLIAAYVFGLRLVTEAQKTPMWVPKQTTETRLDELQADESDTPGLAGLWFRLIVFAPIIAIAGYVLAESGVALASYTGISETVVGGLLTAVCTSLPELVTSVAAVRRGALTLAVSGIIGGNCFDVLFVAFSDFAYRAGSIYHAITTRQVFIISLNILLTAILLLGLLRREQHGIGNIGFESFLILILYLGGFLLLFYQS
jgi:cation:H+ antiporter